MLVGLCLALSLHILEVPFYLLEDNSECNLQVPPQATAELRVSE